jgi:hypothetical protein
MDEAIFGAINAARGGDGGNDGGNDAGVLGDPVPMGG